MAKMKCPKCKSHNISVLSNDENMKTQTSLNLNPLKPFTLFNHKKVKKTSAAKVGLGIMTGGASLLFTGIKKNNLDVFCTNCGHRWKAK